jgi:cell wall-associated NlpC family hydrolase
MTPVDAARRYIGAPWKHGGSDAAGMDCFGLIVAVARDLGIPYPVMTYDRLPDLSLFAALRQFCAPAKGLEPGLLVRMAVVGRAQHLGIVADHPTGLSLIHAYMPLGRVVEHRIDDRWRRRIVSAWRMGVG